MERDALDFVRDELRPLTAKGRKQLRAVSAGLQAMALPCDFILSSPLVRARQTAELVANELKLKKRMELADELKPGGNVKKLIQKITGLKGGTKNVLLVGHEPDLSELISLLVTGGPGAGFALKKGGMAKLEIEKLRDGKCAALRWLLTPGQLKLMR